MQGSIDFSGILSGAITGEGGGGAVPVITATATVDANTGTPEVEVVRSGSDSNPNFNFGFKNLKGSKGDPGTNGTNGSNGSDGFSPAVSITDISNGHRVSITDATHPSGQIFDVMNGSNGQNGTDGTDGTDGYSPAVTIENITGGHSVTITDATHPQGQTFNVLNGSDGQTGQQGPAGPAGPGLPSGGAIGQIIYKASNTDYHTEWGNIPSYDAADINYDPTGRSYVTSTTTQGAVDELDAELYSVNSSLAQLKMTSNQVISFTTVTSTETQYNSYNSRKFSDYDYLVFTFLNGLNDIRDTKIVPRAEWTSGKQVVMNVLHGSSGSSASGFSVSGVVIKYNSDTSIKANYTGAGTIKDVIVYGLLLNK